MKEEAKLLEKVGRDTGYKVPDGYFDEVFDRISASLPERKPTPEPVVTRWQKLRPYLYMAAMFAGIWLMMKVFHDVSQPASISLDNMPGDLVALVQNDNTATYYYDEDYVPDPDLVKELCEEYSSVSELTADMGIQLDEEYANIQIQ